MPANRPIRIIKREQRGLLAAQPELECESKTESQISRDIFKTITLWIEEQRETSQELHQRFFTCEAD
jgi:hypothetical protein